MNHWIQILINQLRQISVWEAISVLFAVAEVLLARANKVLLYPAGIISVVIGIILFYDSGLYAESWLNMYYLVMSIYGWWEWVNRPHHAALKITVADKKDWLVTALIVVAGYCILYLTLRNFTDSKVPVMDAWVSATAWAGMWLLARRKLENWLVLNLSNLFAIPLLFYKGLFLYALLTIFLFIIALLGYRDWKKIIYNNAHHV